MNFVASLGERLIKTASNNNPSLDTLCDTYAEIT